MIIDLTHNAVLNFLAVSWPRDISAFPVFRTIVEGTQSSHTKSSMQGIKFSDQGIQDTHFILQDVSKCSQFLAQTPQLEGPHCWKPNELSHSVYTFVKFHLTKIMLGDFCWTLWTVKLLWKKDTVVSPAFGIQEGCRKDLEALHWVWSGGPKQSQKCPWHLCQWAKLCPYIHYFLFFLSNYIFLFFLLYFGSFML